MGLKKKERQAFILEIIEREDIDSQEELMKYLLNAGIDITQATVSRDINELRIVRHTDATGKYRYAVLTETPKTDANQIVNGFQQLANSVTRVEFMLVIKTTSGNGNRLAALIDGAGLDSVIGTLAGHDTIYVTSPSVQAATALATEFTNWMA
ncbi:MAG: arginine repressor [Lactobacillaceae bacterium]|jgi:transcriptional regulator of arginine metabolism|nr:arginine repressor [Lactobacillaceae bacterium]